MSMYSYMLGLGYIDDLEDGYSDDVVEGLKVHLEGGWIGVWLI